MERETTEENKRGKTLKNSMIMLLMLLFSRNFFQRALKEDLFPKKLILINRLDLLSSDI